MSHEESPRTMNGSRKRPAPGIAEHWRRTRPLPWRLRSMINQRRRSRAG